MAMRNPYSSYSNSAIMTATPEELTLKLYDGTLKFCNQAYIAIESKDYAKAGEYIIKAQTAIREFQITLDRQYEVSKYFDMMYEYIHRRLVDANVSKDLEILDEARYFVREMRDMWKEAMEIAKKSKS